MNIIDKITKLMCNSSVGTIKSDEREFTLYCNKEFKDTFDKVVAEPKLEWINSDYSKDVFISGLMITIVEDEEFDIPMLSTKIIRYKFPEPNLKFIK